jgi:hypothetical protein
MMDETTPTPPEATPAPGLIPPSTSTSPTTSPTYAPAQPVPAASTNIWAVVSLVSSILAWCGLFGIGGIVGIIAGVIARNEIATSRGTQSGDGIALVGIILGALNVFGTCFLLMCAGLALGLPILFLPFSTMGR